MVTSLCAVLPTQGSKDGSDWGSKGMKTRQTVDIQTGQSGLSDGKTSALQKLDVFTIQSSACLLYRAEQRSGSLHTYKQGGGVYGISWTTGTGLGDLGKSSFCREAVFRL